MMSDERQITILLRKSREGDRDAESQLFEAVYGDLKRLASALLAREPSGQSMQATALVNEMYVRMCHNEIDWQDRKHFFAVSARAMRRVLVDHARRRLAEKRPKARDQTEFGDTAAAAQDPALLLSVNTALDELQRLDARQAQIVEMRVFLGMTEDEVADVLHLSCRHVRREWQIARVWLHGHLDSPGG
jgi:RNA polymerase sigma-70 factor, ECF subfamily